jgi:dTDP-4-amino-4,6-dideoxygalactose transaminase
MDGIRAATGGQGITLIEDCAQAHGARIGTARAGALGDIGCFSFYPTKNLGALGDGGAVTTQDARLAERVRALRQYGWDGKYRVVLPGGRNSRLDEIQAALLRVRLPGLEHENARRRQVVQAYAHGIHQPRIHVMPAAGETCVAHLAVVRSPQRERLRAFLAEAGIGTDVHYPIADHQQPAHRARTGDIRLPVTERACAEVLSLPCFPGLTEDEVAHVIATCNAWTA